MINDNDTTFNFNSYGEDMVLVPRFSRYASTDRVALEFWYEETIDEDDPEATFMAPFAKVTVNMPDVHLNEGEVLIKDYAENEALVQALIDEGWLIQTGREVASGFVFPMVARFAGPLLEASQA